MSIYRGLTIKMMTDRVYNRIDNEVFRWSFIRKILQAYNEEIQNALLRGERVQIPGVGTLIPEITTRDKYSLPCCNKEEGNLPYMDIKLTRNKKFRASMTRRLLENIKNGIYGLEKLPLKEEQLDYLKEKGFAPEDAELPDGRND